MFDPVICLLLHYPAVDELEKSADKTEGKVRSFESLYTVTCSCNYIFNLQFLCHNYRQNCCMLLNLFKLLLLISESEFDRGEYFLIANTVACLFVLE